MEEVRIDKWLWAVRIFKTRNLAAEACRKSKVVIDGEPVKPGKTVKRGDVIHVKKQPVIYTYRVKEIAKNRMGAKLVPGYLEDLTPEEELAKLDMVRFNIDGHRKSGEGRPTKKERRELDRFKGM